MVSTLFVKKLDMRVARLVIAKNEYGTIRLFLGTYQEYQNEFSVRVKPYCYFEENRLQDHMRINYYDLLCRHRNWCGAYIGKSIIDIARTGFIREEIYPSSLKNKHILTVKQSAYYAWNKIRRSIKRFFRFKH